MLSINRKSVNSKNLHKTEKSKKVFNQQNLVDRTSYLKKNRIDDK